MSTRESLCRLIGINVSKLSKKEYFMIEAKIFFHLCEKLNEHFKNELKKFQTPPSSTSLENNSMLENNLVKLITCDLLTAEEYDITGIAHYSDTPEDIIQEIIDGRNLHPSANLLLRLIDLHRIARRSLYDNLLKKIVMEQFSV